MKSSNLKTLAKELVSYLSQGQALINPQQVSYHYIGNDDEYTVIIDLMRAQIVLTLLYNTGQVYSHIECGDSKSYLSNNDFATIQQELLRLLTEQYFDELDITEETLK